MPAKKIVCPLCDESVVLGKPAKSGNYFCPSCHGEIVVQRSKRKIRERRSGVVVGGEVYGVKGPAESAFHGESGTHAEGAPQFRPKRELPEGTEPQADPEVAEEHDFADLEEEFVRGPAQMREESPDDYEDDEDLDDDEGIRESRSPRHSRTSRSAARMAVAIVLLVLVGIVSAVVIWLQGVFGGPGETVADSGPRLQIPVSGVSDEDAVQPSSGPGERRAVDVDRIIDSTRRVTGPESVPAVPSAASTGVGTEAPSQPQRQPRTGLRQEDIQAAADAARAFVGSSSAEERGRMIRNRDTDLPLLLDHYRRYPQELSRGGNVVRMVTGMDDYPLIGFMVVFPDGSERFIGVDVSDGEFRVDWPSFAVHHEREWRDFVGNRISSPTLMRVFASPVDYYNFGFDDPEVYYCLRLENGRDPYGDEPIYGYIRRDHPQFNELVQLAEVAGQFAMPLVLRINFPLLAQSGDQVEITELVSNGWMIRD